MRLILDTSVVVSALRNSSGASAQLLLAGLTRKFVLLVSVPLVVEYESVLKRSEQITASGLSISQVEDVLAAILRSAIEIDLGPYVEPASVDITDNHVLSLAQYGAADAIVSFNTRHFVTPARLLGVNLHTPVEALRALGR